MRARDLLNIFPMLLFGRCLLKSDNPAIEHCIMNGMFDLHRLPVNRSQDFEVQRQQIENAMAERLVL